ncbi:hypothetical protein Tcan_06196 [Toxocara canis]|uniref:Uncharacterized protein n=1 Tax=Toxocara canis TaxID=6265 RepID=A0A0B2W3X3_TOXCA|nr:hypothetical protein Tcan_06196 [Toxocara canis]
MVAAVGKGMRWCMPAVVENQQQKFEMDPEIRQLVGPTQIAYAGCLHAPMPERCSMLIENCSEREQRHIPIIYEKYYRTGISPKNVINERKGDHEGRFWNAFM